MTESEIEGAALLFNRKNEQCKFLLNLCKWDKRKYIQLEMAIKEQLIAYCPTIEEQIYKILSDARK